MNTLKQAIHTTLRDDADATVGLRALLGAAATPYGVYFTHLPETPDFPSHSYLTWYFISEQTTSAPDSDAKLREQVFSVTAWSKDPDTVDDVLKRARWLLENRKRVTSPTSEVELHAIKAEQTGPSLYDDRFMVYYRADQYRAYYREDVTWA
jgi:hypothetical protein